MPDDLLQRLRRFHDDHFPALEGQCCSLLQDGQHPNSLFIGCFDSRLLPCLLTGAGPGEVFMIRNVGAFVPPHGGFLVDAATGPSERGGAAEPQRWVGYHGTAAATEYAVRSLGVQRITVCGHSHCGGIRALYAEIPAQAVRLAAWLALGPEAALPVQVTPEALKCTEQRSVVLQLDRLVGLPDGARAGRGCPLDAAWLALRDRGR